MPKSGQQKILDRLAKEHIPFVYGRNGWRPCYLPKGATRADVDALLKAKKAIMVCGNLVLNN